MSAQELTALIYGADRQWVKDNAGERRPREFAEGTAAVIWERVFQPVAADTAALADRVAQLESHCSCWKPDVVPINAPSRAELWGRIADALSILGHRPLNESTKDAVTRVLRGESVAVSEREVR